MAMRLQKRFAMMSEANQCSLLRSQVMGKKKIAVAPAKQGLIITLSNLSISDAVRSAFRAHSERPD